MMVHDYLPADGPAEAHLGDYAEVRVLGLDLWFQLRQTADGIKWVSALEPPVGARVWPWVGA